jgi:hypothetical protein
MDQTGARVFFLSDVGRQLAFASTDGIAVITSQLIAMETLEQQTRQ